MHDAALDDDRLAELEAEIGSDDLRAVLEMFLQEAADAVAAIEDGLAPEGHAKSMHFLRSGALNLGLAGLAAEARRIAALDVAARAGDVVRPALADAIAISRAALQGRSSA